MSDSTLRQICTDATRAFLQKNYAQCLLQIQKGMSMHYSIPSSDVWLEQLLVLRFTVVHSVYVSTSERTRVLDALSRETSIIKLFSMPPSQLYATLWYECLYTMSHLPMPDPCPSSLETSEDICSMILLLPAPLISSAILMALRMDAYADTTQRKGTPSSCARQTCECFFAATLHQDEHHFDLNTYEKIMRLYVLQVLGTHLGEWDPARHFIQNCVLPAQSKAAVLNDLERIHKELDLRVLRESDVLRHAQQQYADEMARRSSTKAKDTPTFQDAVPIKDEPMASSKLQRMPSIHGREKKNTSTPTSELIEQGDTHAMKRSHLQSYLQRRSLSESSSEVSRPHSVNASYLLRILSSSLTRQSLVSAIVLLATVLLAFFSKKRGILTTPNGAPWSQRLWETFRMATQVTYL